MARTGLWARALAGMRVGPSAFRLGPSALLLGGNRLRTSVRTFHTFNFQRHMETAHHQANFRHAHVAHPIAPHMLHLKLRLTGFTLFLGLSLYEARVFRLHTVTHLHPLCHGFEAVLVSAQGFHLFVEISSSAGW